METHQKNRFIWLDVLRGIAVILMVQQHFMIWLWNIKGSIVGNINKYPVMITLNGLGGLSAPLFILLAGVGTALYLNYFQKPAKTLALRGLVILLFGYLLNLAVPSWFSAGSWYVLHIIGFSIMLSPLFAKRKTRQLLVLAALIIITGMFLQYWLNTPTKIGNSRMGNYSMPGGIFRLLFAEGHFPVFPWLALYIAGFVSGRWFIDQKIKTIAKFAVWLLIISGVLHFSYMFIYPLSTIEILSRFCKIIVPFYPITAVVFLFLTASAILLFVILYALRNRPVMRTTNLVSHLGRVSLTILVLHAVIFRQGNQIIGLWKKFNHLATAGLIIGTLTLAAFCAKWWSETGYRFSLEWLVRKIPEKINNQD